MPEIYFCSQHWWEFISSQQFIIIMGKLYLLMTGRIQLCSKTYMYNIAWNTSTYPSFLCHQLSFTFCSCWDHLLGGQVWIFSLALCIKTVISVQVSRQVSFEDSSWYFICHWRKHQNNLDLYYDRTGLYFAQTFQIFLAIHHNHRKSKTLLLTGSI